MSTLAFDLQHTLQELDSDSASKLERLVRDAIALARPKTSSPTKTEEVDANGWPIGYFERTFGCAAGEEWELPDDPPPAPSTEP